MGGVGAKAQTREVTPEQLEAWQKVFSQAIDLLEEDGADYLVGGSTVCNHWGRPAAIGDVDLLVKPTDAKRLLKLFGEQGYETEETYAQWLYKAKPEEGPTIDLIFELEGAVYLDQDMVAHGSYADVFGTKARLMSPEDYIVSQALSTEEDTPDYWHNALSVIAKSDVDYDYLVERATNAGGRRVLSLLVYADSNDLRVPESTIRRLFEAVYGR